MEVRIEKSLKVEVNYDADYFEHGIQTGVSLFENYRWIPELTIPMAMVINDYLGIRRGETILDIGCAKGYMVKAFRWLGRDAYGYDISAYAIEQADQEIKDFLHISSYPNNCKYAIAKDVFEHFEERELESFLSSLNSDVLFIMVPLGDGERYIIPQYECDLTHKIRQPYVWWKVLLEDCGWKVKRAEHRIDGLKDNWAHYKDGNIFITAIRR